MFLGLDCSDAFRSPKPITLLALDPATVPTVSAFQAKFDELANSLMNDYILDVNGRPHRLAEIEFYLKDENHFDAFTHGDEVSSCGLQN